MQKSDVNFYMEITNNIMKYAEDNDYELVPTFKAISEYLVVMAGIFAAIDEEPIDEEAESYDSKIN